jgi:phosphatidylserine/phosphatidylglycerophosphate/cardiolipin synthase-like enzyme
MIGFFLFVTAILSTTSLTAIEQAAAYFSPYDKVEDKLIDSIAKENRSIRIAIYSLTHRKICDALIDAKQRNVDVEVVVDRASLRARTPIRKMVEAGVPVFVWDPFPNVQPHNRSQGRRSLMHHKFCIFGDETVWTGSFNFTYEASRRHQENVVVLKDGMMVNDFKNQFNRIKLSGCTPFTTYEATHPKK